MWTPCEFRSNSLARILGRGSNTATVTARAARSGYQTAPEINNTFKARSSFSRRTGVPPNENASRRSRPNLDLPTLAPTTQFTKSINPNTGGTVMQPKSYALGCSIPPLLQMTDYLQELLAESYIIEPRKRLGFEALTLVLSMSFLASLAWTRLGCKILLGSFANWRPFSLP